MAELPVYSFFFYALIAAMASLVLATGLQIVAFIHNPRDPLGRTFLLLLISWSCYVGLSIYHHTLMNIEQISRVYSLMILLRLVVVFLLVVFFRYCALYKWTSFTKVAISLLGVLLVLHFLSPHSLQVKQIVALQQVEMRTGDIYYDLHYVCNKAYYVFLGLCIAVVIWMTNLVRLLWKEKRKTNAYLLLCLTLLVVLCISISISFVLMERPRMPLLEFAGWAILMVMLFFFYHDVSRRALQVNVFDRLNHRLAGISQSIPGVFFQLKQAENGLKVIYLDGRVQELLGFDAKKSEPLKAFAAHLDVNERELMMIRAQNILESGQGDWSTEVAYQHPEGTRWLSLVAAVQQEEEGRSVMTGMVLDVSEKFRYQHEREESMKQLKLLHEEQKTVLFTVSHDIRAPLVNISGFSREIMANLQNLENRFGETLVQDQDARKIHVNLSHIEKNMSRANDMIKSLLYVLRASRVEMILEDLDTNNLLNKVLETMEHQLKAFHVKVDVGHMPLCRGDSVQVQMIFANLLENAIKFRHLERPLHIRVFGEEHGDQVEIHVVDNGIGIPPGQEERIFKMFVQLNTLYGNMGGGIGLALVRSAILKQGGSIRAISGLKIGSDFEIKLPAIV